MLAVRLGLVAALATLGSAQFPGKCIQKAHVAQHKDHGRRNNGVCSAGFCLSHAGKFRNHGKKAKVKGAHQSSHACAAACHADRTCKAYHYQVSQGKAGHTTWKGYCELYTKLDLSKGNKMNIINVAQCQTKVGSQFSTQAHAGSKTCMYKFGKLPQQKAQCKKKCETHGIGTKAKCDAAKWVRSVSTKCYSTAGKGQDTGCAVQTSSKKCNARMIRDKRVRVCKWDSKAKKCGVASAMWAKKHGKACVSKTLIKNNKNCLKRMDWTTKRSCSWKTKAKTVQWKPAPCCTFKDCHLAAYSKSEACVKNAMPGTKCPASAMAIDEAFTGAKFQKGKGVLTIPFKGTLGDFQAEYPTCGTFYVKSIKIQLHARTQITTCKVNPKAATTYAKKDKNWYKSFKCTSIKKGKKVDRFCVCPKDASGHALQPAVCTGATNCKNDVGKYGNFVLTNKKKKVIAKLNGWKLTADWKRHPAYTWKMPAGKVKVSDLGSFSMKAKWNNGIVLEHLLVEAYSTSGKPSPSPGCPAYRAKYSKSKGGAFVTPVVTQTAYGKNGATFQLSVDLKGQAASLYSIHGTSKGPLSMPPAYQSSKSPLVGAPNPLYKQGDDSYLTIGLPYVNKKQIAASPKFPAWTASKGLSSKNAAMFWMNPKAAPSHGKSILVAQVTVKVPCSKKWSAEMGMTGYKLNGQAWRDDDVVFAWSKFAMPKPGCPVYIPPATKTRNGRFVNTVVTQTAYGKNGATFQLAVKLKGQAASLYSIHGTARGDLSMPPAYQSSKSPLVGAPNPLYKQGDDSYLTVGLPYVNKKQIAATAMPKWTANVALHTSNSAVFWMNPKSGPKAGKPIVVAQVTVKVPCTKLWAAEMGLSGYLRNGKQWRDDKVAFVWSKFKAGCKAPPATKNCPSYCSNFKKSKSGRYATPTVTQTGFGSNGATFQLTATLKGAARNLYSVHGTAGGALILPPAYQSSKSPAVGGPNPIFRQGDDSYITVGLALNNKQIAQTPNFPSWNARRGVESTNAAIFWMNPNAGPKKGKPILVAQITVPVPCSKSWSVVMGLTGYLSNGKTWRDDSVVFAWSKFKMSGKKCPADVEYKKGPGVINVEDLLVILSAFGSKCPSQVSCEVDIETKRSPGEITVEDLLAVLSAFGMPCGN